MEMPDFLMTAAEGEIRLAGHRIGLYHLVHLYNEGYSPEMLVCQYPTLPLALIHKVIAFYLEHREEVDAYVAACQVALGRQRDDNPTGLDLPTLRKRLASLQQVDKS